MLDTIGKRLKCCRAATATSTHDVVSYINDNGGDLAYGSYTRWESGSNIPKKKSHLIKYIADFFKKHGLYVSKEWIESGEGFPPQFAEYTNLDEDTLFILTARNIPDSEIIQVGGIYGEPYVNFGEMCIISSNSALEGNNNKLCWLKISGFNSPVIGKVLIKSETDILIKGSSNIDIKKNRIKECRKIKWILKK